MPACVLTRGGINAARDLETPAQSAALSHSRSARLTSPRVATLAAQIAAIQASRFHHGDAVLIELKAPVLAAPISF
jgi:hypothetical protein